MTGVELENGKQGNVIEPNAAAGARGQLWPCQPRIQIRIEVCSALPWRSGTLTSPTPDRQKSCSHIVVSRHYDNIDRDKSGKCQQNHR